MFDIFYIFREVFMTNRERVISAIEHRQPDKVPHNVVFTGEMLEKMIRHTGNDEYMKTVNNHIVKGSARKPQIPVEGKAEYFKDEFDVVWNKSGADKDIGVVDEYILADLEMIYEYDPPPVDEDYVHEQCKRLVETKGTDFSYVSIGFTLFERAWSLCGMENLLGFMLTDPEAVMKLFAKLTERNIRQAEIALQYDIDGILFGDDWGQQRGMIMGPPLWRKMIKPHIFEMYKTVKDKGKYVLQHSCGDLREIVDELIDIGLDVYQTFQPEIYDLREYKEKFRSKLTIWAL